MCTFVIKSLGVDVVNAPRVLTADCAYPRASRLPDDEIARRRLVTPVRTEFDNSVSTKSKGRICLVGPPSITVSLTEEANREKMMIAILHGGATAHVYRSVALDRNEVQVGVAGYTAHDVAESFDHLGDFIDLDPEFTRQIHETCGRTCEGTLANEGAIRKQRELDFKQAKAASSSASKPVDM